MERLIKQWEQKLKSYQSTIDGLPVASRDRSFWLGKKAALETAVEELKNFISFNLPVMRSDCDHDRHYSEIDGFAYCNKCGAVMP